MLAGDAHKLIESNLIASLSPPGRVADTSWIRPGKAAWDWWSGRVVEGAPFKPGMNDETMKAYIDLAAELGLEYMLVDAGSEVRRGAFVFGRPDSITFKLAPGGGAAMIFKAR